MPDVALSCACGEVQGLGRDFSPKTGNRTVCYCKDCQAFAAFLEGDDIVDAKGGTDLFQVPPARITVNSGLEKLACVRVTRKGVFRWYAACCKTPIGNTVNADLPFVGVFHSFMALSSEERDKHLGPANSHVQIQDATSPVTEGRAYEGFPKVPTLKLLIRFMGWKMKGLGRPNPFFTSEGRTIVKPKYYDRETHSLSKGT